MFKSYELNLPVGPQGDDFVQYLSASDEDQLQALEAQACAYENAARQCRALAAELQTDKYPSIKVKGAQACIFLEGEKSELEALTNLHVIQLFEYDDEGDCSCVST